MKSSKYTQANEPLVDGTDVYQPSGSDVTGSKRNLTRTYSGNCQIINNSEELLLKGYNSYGHGESLFEMQRYSPERSATTYFAPGQDFELVCNCALKEICKPRTRSQFNSEQNIVMINR